MTPASDWIKWTGGPCPVAPDTLVAIILRSGTICGDKFPLTAQHWDDCDSDEPSSWLHAGAADDIIAYRIVSPSQPRTSALGVGA